LDRAWATGADHPLITANWPDAGTLTRDARRQRSRSTGSFKLVSKEVSAVPRPELGMPPGAISLTAHFPVSLLEARTDMRGTRRFCVSLDLRTSASTPRPAGASAQLVVEGETITVPLEGVIDIAAERDRLSKALAAAAKERDGLAGRLNNPSFVERAKPEAVEKARADHAAKEAEADRLTAALARLG
jgi:valyl-tRNA synthetase